MLEQTKNQVNPHTPETAKAKFSKFLFPCWIKWDPTKGKFNKGPAISDGATWSQIQSRDKTLIRNNKGILCGLDLSHSCLTVVDLDVYSPHYKNNPKAKKLAAKIAKICNCQVRTASGGVHLYFKGPMASQTPYPGIDILSAKKFVCLYDDPFKEFDTFEDGFKSLTQVSEVIHLVKKEFENDDTKKVFGPGLNNNAIPHRTTGNRGKNIEALKELVLKNQNNPELPKHLNDFLDNVVKKERPKKEKESEPEFYKVIEREPDPDLENYKKTPSEYVDSFGQFKKGVMSLISGDTGLGKTMGTAAFLLSEGANIAYYSCSDVHEDQIADLKKQAKEKNWPGSIQWFDINRIGDNAVYERFKKFVGGENRLKVKIDIVWDDPADNPSNLEKDENVFRAFYGARERFAIDHNLHWIVSRNYNKTPGMTGNARIKGSSLYFQLFRVVFHVLPVERGSKGWIDQVKEAKTKSIRVLSILWPTKVSKGKWPKRSIIFRIFEHSREWDDVPSVEVDNIGKPEDIEAFRKTESVEATEKKNTARHILYSILSKNEGGLKPGDLKVTLVKDMKLAGEKMTTNQAQKLIDKLKLEKKIEGGGQGKHSKPIIIVAPGKTEFNKLSS